MVLISGTSQLPKGDFASALSKFGINAMFFRISRLCMGYPDSIRNQFLDFRANMQWMEVERVRVYNKGIDARAAYNQYHMCTLMNAPDVLPVSKDDVETIMSMHDYCSRWASVLAQDMIGAFRMVPQEVSASVF